MDYSKIPLQIMENKEIFPGKLAYLAYPSSNEEKSVFIHPLGFYLAEQVADSSFSYDFSNQKILFYCLGGNGSFHYCDSFISFSKGQGLFLDGNRVSGMFSGSEGSRYTLFFMTGDLAGELQRISEERNAFSFNFNQFHDFEQRQFILIRSFPGKLYDKEYDFSCHMSHLLVRILQLKADASCPENDEHRQMIQQVLTYMQAHFAENINIKDIAAHFNYSSSQFQKFFQEQTYTTPKQHLIQIRVREAEKLLLHTNLPVEEVCTRCGFNNANHFIRVFRQYNTKTPLQYRRENRRSDGLF